MPLGTGGQPEGDWRRAPLRPVGPCGHLDPGLGCGQPDLRGDNRRHGGDARPQFRPLGPTRPPRRVRWAQGTLQKAACGNLKGRASGPLPMTRLIAAAVWRWRPRGLEAGEGPARPPALRQVLCPLRRPRRPRIRPSLALTPLSFS